MDFEVLGWGGIGVIKGREENLEIVVGKQFGRTILGVSRFKQRF